MLDEITDVFFFSLFYVKLTFKGYLMSKLSF